MIGMVIIYVCNIRNKAFKAVFYTKRLIGYETAVDM